MMDIFLRGIIVVYNNIIYCEFNVTKSDWKLQYFLMWNVKKKKRWWSAELIFRINEFIRYLFDLINIYYNLNDIYPMEYDWIGEINSRIWIVYFFCLCYNQVYTSRIAYFQIYITIHDKMIARFSFIFIIHMCV